jgi:HlyD family type I secretion membrane fusion protein
MSQTVDILKKAKDEESGISQRPSSSSTNVIVFGFLVVCVIFVGVGIWSATAPLSQAVAAFATLVIKGDRKQIQHFEGGIVGVLYVDEGQPVEQGELLVALNPLQASAQVARHDSQLDHTLALEARLSSELKGERVIILEGQLLERISVNPVINNILEAEQRHLSARRDTLDGTIIILKQRIDQLNNEIDGLEIQRDSRLEQLDLFRSELVGLRGLHEKGYFPKSKILAMERAIAELRGAAGNDAALIARAKSARAEAENQIVSVKQRFREDIVKQLRDIQVEISDLRERLLVAEDVLERIEIHAPRSGIVQDLKFHTVGGVVKPGDILMEIAPQDDDLIVHAQVQPTDIDNIAIGQRAEVRLTALNSRTTPAIYGNVISVSGDSLPDPRSNVPYYLTRIDIPITEREKLGEIKLKAGMPADVLIQTGERTALNYLLKPMIDAFARGLNEE